MENTQKIIVVLLIVAIMFSLTSIFISMGALNVELPRSNVGHVVSSGSSSGQIGLSIEGNNEGGTG